MAETLTGERIRRLVSEGKVIENGLIDNCGSIKYDFTLSNEILKSDFRSPVNMENLTAEERRNAVIQPGEVVYVLTKERVNIPANMYMSLSANRGMSEYGILTLGGFAVDPGYSGRLMFGLYNYSSSPFTLIPGAKLIGGVFYQLTDEESIDEEKIAVPKEISSFPAGLVNIISSYSPIGLTSLEESINVIYAQMDALNEELRKRREEVFNLRHLIESTQEQTNKTSKTVDELAENVKKIGEEVQNLRDGLHQEVELRKSMSEEIDKKLELATLEVTKKVNFLKGGLWLATAFIGILGTLFVTWAAGLLNL